MPLLSERLKALKSIGSVQFTKGEISINFQTTEYIETFITYLLVCFRFAEKEHAFPVKELFQYQLQKRVVLSIPEQIKSKMPQLKKIQFLYAEEMEKTVALTFSIKHPENSPSD